MNVTFLCVSSGVDTRLKFTIEPSLGKNGFQQVSSEIDLDVILLSICQDVSNTVSRPEHKHTTYKYTQTFIDVAPEYKSQTSPKYKKNMTYTLEKCFINDFFF